MFSHCYQTKPHSKAKIKLLDALVEIYSYLLSNAICCADFEYTTDMIKLHKGVDPYSHTESSSINGDETEYLEDIIH